MAVLFVLNYIYVCIKVNTVAMLLLSMLQCFNSIDVAIIMHVCMLLHGAVICMK